MNVECQTIRVPTGVQDYRPAFYGGTAAVELRVDGIRRVPIDVDPRELERRLVLAYTGAPRNSGTNNWEITKRHLDGDQDIFDGFERIRDTAVAMRTALERAEWDEVGRQIAAEWENRKRLAPGVTTPTIDDLIAQGASCGRHRRQSLRRGRRRLSVLLRPSRGAAGDRRRARRGRRPRARLPPRDGRAPRWITPRLRTSCARSPISWRSRTTTPSRFVRIATARTSPPTILINWRGSMPRPARDSRASGRISPRASAKSPRPAAPSITASSPPSFLQSVLDLLHLQGVGPKTAATLYRELGIRSLEELQQAATDGRIRSLRGMGAKKEALILKALEERARYAGRHLLSHASEAADALVGFLRERAPTARASSRSEACGADATPAATSTCWPPAPIPFADGGVRRLSAGRASARARRHEIERPASAAASRRISGSSSPTAAARRCSISPARRLTTSSFAIARSASATS